MTPDTKRALEAIEPIAKVLRIKVEADEKRLYCNGQAIGIACNSTWATVMEFIGYAFINAYCKDRCVSLTRTARERIKDYWIPKKVIEMDKKAEARE